MIGLIGFGFVGQAVYASLKDKGYCKIIDPKRGTSTDDEYFQKHLTTDPMNGLGFNTLIVCVDTPQGVDGNVDITNFASVYDSIKEFEGLVIVKSTIPKDLFPEDKNWILNPEFLNANSAGEDFLNQDYIVLGGDAEYTLKAANFYSQDTKVECKKFEFCTVDEASDFKYLRNIKQAYNLMYWEFVQDVTGNARKISQMMKNIPVSENDVVGMDGFRGFGGACLPKDISAFEKNNPHKLTKYLQDFNEDFE